MKGVYILLIKNREDRYIQIGKLRNIFFKRGFYVYVGSALNGLEQRINRHLRIDKKLHWHIDYLLRKSEIISVFYKETKSQEECKIANIFQEKLELIPGFGCSDCKCKSHLFYGEHIDITKITKKLGLNMYCKS